MEDFIIQFLAAALLFGSVWTMGNTRLLGPFLGFISNAFTTWLGLSHHLWSFVLIGVVLFFMQGRNFLKWRKEGVAW